MEWIDKANLVGMEGAINMKTSLNRLNRVPKCDVTKILFLENCNFGLKF